jgi:hypothetical protein
MEKDYVERELSAKTGEICNGLQGSLQKVEDDMRKYCLSQKAEQSKLQQMITTMKGEKTALNQQLIGKEKA